MVCLLKIHYLSDYAWLEMQILIEPTQLFLKYKLKDTWYFLLLHEISLSSPYTEEYSYYIVNIHTKVVNRWALQKY